MQVKKYNLTEQIYKNIKNDIFKNKIRQGEKISINKVAKKYGVSHTPAREAIKNLIKDGLVIGSINKVHKVINLTKKDLLEATEIRKICEIYSINKIIRNLGSKEIKNLNNQIKKLRSFQKEGNLTTEDFYFADTSFHKNLIESTCNSILIDIYQRIRHLINIMIFRIDSREKIADVFFKQHIDILKTILDRDEKAANELLEHHIEKSLEYYEENFLH